MRRWFPGIMPSKVALVTALELSGSALIIVGVWEFSWPLAFIVAGVLLIFLAQGGESP